MSSKVPVDMTDLERPKFKNRRQPFWKGDHIGGWQICMDHARTKGNPGKVMPVIIDYPIGGQFSSVYEVEKVNPKTGDTYTTHMPVEQFKGFKSVEEGLAATPSPAIVNALLDNECANLERTLQDKGVSDPDKIRAEVDAFRHVVLKANGLAEESENVIETAKKERASVKRGRPKKSA